MTRGETRPDDDLDTGSYQFVVSDVLFTYYMNSVSGVFDYDLNRFQIFHLCRFFYFFLIVFHLLYLYLLLEIFMLLFELCCNTLQHAFSPSEVYICTEHLLSDEHLLRNIDI